jgi:hypothetical protein
MGELLGWIAVETRLGEKSRETKVEILDALGAGLSYILMVIVELRGYKMMPHIKAITNMQVVGKYRANEESTDNSGWTRIMALLPKLKYINVSITANSKHWSEFSASSLMTLSYSIPVPRSASNLNKWGLPSMDNHYASLSSLRHVRLPSLYSSYLGTQQEQQQHLLTLGIPTERKIDAGLLRFLADIGSNLLSLQIGSSFLQGKVMMDEIWHICPRLVRLDSGFLFLFPPPLNHPIHTISIFIPPYPSSASRLPRRVSPGHATQVTDSSPIRPSNANKNFTPFFPPSLIKSWPSLRRLIVQGDKRGGNDMERLVLRGQISLCNWLVDLAQECRQHFISLENSEGVTFDTLGLDKLLESN